MFLNMVINPPFISVIQLYLTGFLIYRLICNYAIILYFNRRY